MDISTRFMGLSLPNPVIVSSSSLTADVSGVEKAAAAGAGAVVLKSLFEEDIAAATKHSRQEASFIHPEAAQYVEQMGMILEPNDYLSFVEKSVAAVEVPIIASLNCHTTHWWVDYAQRIATVGADAIELNISPVVLDSGSDGRKIEDTVIDMVIRAREAVSIPLAVKIGSNFSSLPNLAARIESAGADALTLFNRFYRMDIDIDRIALQSGNSLSAQEEFGPVLRWIGIISDITDMDIAASTGVYDAPGLIKVLLAGGSVAQFCSVLYREGMETIGGILDGLRQWMTNRGFDKVDDFRSRLSLNDYRRNQFYQRLQYVKALKGR